LIAGAARVEITPRTPQHLAGYAARNHPSTGVHDPISLRALYLRNPRGEEGVLVSADILWFGSWLPVRIRELVGEDLGIPRERLALFGVHTHSAPGAREETAAYQEWLNSVAGRALAAIALAKCNARPARLGIARGESRIGINRREKTADGKIILGKNPKGPIDRELIALAVDGTDGEPIARIANFACHGVVMGQESYLVSGDWPGTAARKMERKTGETPFLFLNGGCGNVNSRMGPQNDFGPVEELASEFAGDFLAASKRLKAPSGGGGRVIGLERSIRLPSKKDGKLLDVTIKGLRLGPVRIVGFPGELFSETVMAVKQAYAGKPVMVCSYSEESESGYVPVREAYAEGGYEVGASRLSEMGEALVRQELIDLVATLGAK
jgi:hypothetical protein